MSEEFMSSITQTAADAGFKLLGAILLWFIGRWLIGVANKLIRNALTRQKFDETLQSYIVSAASVLLNIALIVAILGYFGVETTTFAALIAAAGVAIGMAWSGLLAHFAAGIFLVVLRPIKAGDFVTVAGVTGTVHEIGLFVTVLDTLDNVRTIVGNNQVFSATIQNFTTNPHRRVELVAQLAHGADHAKAIEILKSQLAKIPNVVGTPAPEVEVLEFNLAGPVLAVRPYCHNDHYWQVYFDTNRVIREGLGEAGFDVPQTHYHVAHKAA